MYNSHAAGDFLLEFLQGKQRAGVGAMSGKALVEFPDMAFRNGNGLVIGGYVVPEVFKEYDFSGMLMAAICGMSITFILMMLQVHLMQACYTVFQLPGKFGGYAC